MKRTNWNETFMTMAYIMAMRSPDKKTRVGAIIVDEENVVVAMGYNGWCRGSSPWSDDDPRHERPLKYMYTEHAERNAIYNSARKGVSLSGGVLYVTIAPCMDCARGIVQVGIKKVVVHQNGQDAYNQAYGLDAHNWTEDHKQARQLFQDAGVELEFWEGDIVMPKAYFNEQVVDL